MKYNSFYFVSLFNISSSIVVALAVVVVRVFANPRGIEAKEKRGFAALLERRFLWFRGISRKREKTKGKKRVVEYVKQSKRIRQKR
jgi:hypothetical protein